MPLPAFRDFDFKSVIETILPILLNDPSQYHRVEHGTRQEFGGHKWRRVVPLIMASIDQDIAVEMMDGIANGFEGVNFEHGEALVETTDQGVYLAILLKNGEFYRNYVGCAWGLKKGLQGRVHEHLRQGHRDDNSDKKLYRCMDESEEVTYHFVRVARFRTEVKPEMCFLVEGLFTALFAAQATPAYRQARRALMKQVALPEIAFKIGLNRQDPLCSSPRLNGKLPHEVASAEKWGRMLTKFREGASRKLWRHSGGGFETSIGNLVIRHYGTEMAKLGMTQPGKVTTRVEISELARHPNAFAPRCSLSDDGAKIGVQMTAVVGNVSRSIWIVRGSGQGLSHNTTAYANGLYEFISGRVIDPATHTWPADRFPILGPVGIDEEWMARNGSKSASSISTPSLPATKKHSPAVIVISDDDSDHDQIRPLPTQRPPKRGRETLAHSEESDHDEADRRSVSHASSVPRFAPGLDPELQLGVSPGMQGNAEKKRPDEPEMEVWCTVCHGAKSHHFDKFTLFTTFGVRRYVAMKMRCQKCKKPTHHVPVDGTVLFVPQGTLYDYDHGVFKYKIVKGKRVKK